MTLRDLVENKVAGAGIQTRTGKKWSKKTSVDQAENMLHILYIQIFYKVWFMYNSFILFWRRTNLALSLKFCKLRKTESTLVDLSMSYLSLRSSIQCKRNLKDNKRSNCQRYDHFVHFVHIIKSDFKLLETFYIFQTCYTKCASKLIVNYYRHWNGLYLYGFYLHIT